MTGAAALVRGAEAVLPPCVVLAPGGRGAARSALAKRNARRTATIPQNRLPVALVVEDEPAAADLWRRVLARCGWAVELAPTATDALRCVAHAGDRVGLAIVDDKLPDGRGLRLVTLLRALRPAPLLVLVSAYGDAERWTEARKAGFSLIHKPASEAQCRALLDLLGAHPEAANTPPLDTRAGPPVLVLRDDGVETPEGAVHLRPMEHTILSLLLAHEGEPLTTAAIGAHLGRGDAGTARGVHKQVSNLRKALGLYRRIIETVTGGGYRLRPGWLRRKVGSCGVGTKPARDQ